MSERAVTLEELLTAREERAARQKEILEETGATALISLTIVRPGPIKRTERTRELFFMAQNVVMSALFGMSAAPLYAETRERNTGDEWLAALYFPALLIKRRMCELEEQLPYGRLLDIDVLDGAGAHISRAELGLMERGCLVCGAPGRACAASRAHTLEELEQAQDRIFAAMEEGV